MKSIVLETDITYKIINENRFINLTPFMPNDADSCAKLKQSHTFIISQTSFYEIACFFTKELSKRRCRIYL